MAGPTLKFIDGQFFLEHLAVRLLTMTRPDQWAQAGKNAWVTSNLKEAARFRSYADANCEKVFTRAFNRVADPAPRLPTFDFLDPHQNEGVHWILSRSRSYLAHAPGAGKTVQAIVASSVAPGAQSLFIVPPTLVTNWVKEIERFTEYFEMWPTIEVVPLSDGKDRMNWAADHIICPDSMLAKEWVHTALAKIKFKFIAVDEASRFKESTSERSIVFYGGYSHGKRYPGLYQSARHCVFLDGSPMPNRAMELWAPTFALDPMAIDCMDRDDFGFRYGGATLNERGQWEYKGTSREPELKAKLQKTFMHVVTEDKLTHPERLRSILFMNEDVRSQEHKSWERKHLTAQTYAEHLGSPEWAKANQGQLVTFRRELGVRKIPFIARYVRERLDEKNESILLFVWHREVAEKLWKELGDYHPGIVMGGTSASQRDKYFGDFQSGDTKLIIGNIQAMGRGHNLQRADRVIFGEFSWTDELNKQCEKRASRRGNEKAFTRCEYIVCPNSIDEKVLGSVFTKERRVRGVIG